MRQCSALVCRLLSPLLCSPLIALHSFRSAALCSFVALRSVAFHTCRGSGSWRGTSHCIRASQSQEYNRVASAMPVRFSLLASVLSPRVPSHYIASDSIPSARPAAPSSVCLCHATAGRKSTEHSSRARAARRDAVAAAVALFSSLLFPPALQSSLISISFSPSRCRATLILCCCHCSVDRYRFCTAQHGTNMCCCLCVRALNVT